MFQIRTKVTGFSRLKSVKNLTFLKKIYLLGGYKGTGRERISSRFPLSMKPDIGLDPKARRS